MTVFVVGPLSGSQANTGQTVAGGVKLLAEQLNRSGGLLGYRIKVVTPGRRGRLRGGDARWQNR